MEDHTHLDSKDYTEHSNDTLIVLVEKCKYIHDD